VLSICLVVLVRPHRLVSPCNDAVVDQALVGLVVVVGGLTLWLLLLLLLGLPVVVLLLLLVVVEGRAQGCSCGSWFPQLPGIGYITSVASDKQGWLAQLVGMCLVIYLHLVKVPCSNLVHGTLFFP
jgi:hypothetical protein